MKSEVIISKDNKGFKDEVKVLVDKFPIIEKLPFKILEGLLVIIESIR